MYSFIVLIWLEGRVQRNLANIIAPERGKN